jgi:hypothetical protein
MVLLLQLHSFSFLKPQAEKVGKPKAEEQMEVCAEKKKTPKAGKPKAEQMEAYAEKKKKPKKEKKLLKFQSTRIWRSCRSQNSLL